MFYCWGALQVGPGRGFFLRGGQCIAGGGGHCGPAPVWRQVAGLGEGSADPARQGAARLERRGVGAGSRGGRGAVKTPLLGHTVPPPNPPADPPKPPPDPPQKAFIDPPTPQNPIPTPNSSTRNPQSPIPFIASGGVGGRGLGRGTDSVNPPTHPTHPSPPIKRSKY